ncbi:MAG: hypothetical protein NWE93_09585 [Candidatus Bathyarchaeota archaeon]|nr:hypothetical protein [Candidatus Bathyarchaeota archaeon]
MQKTTKAAITILILITSVSLLPNVLAKTSTPAIAWQKQYGGGTMFISNLIQTSDGGFAFLGSGWHSPFTFTSTLYKLDSAGEVEWTKDLDDFTASMVIQTSDEGYEVYGQGSYSEHHTLLKLDTQGNVQWSVNSSMIGNFPTELSLTQISTSNGGYAYVNSSQLVVTDSNNQVILSETTTFEEYFPTGPTTVDYDVLPFSIDSLVETSDGAVAGLGIGFSYTSIPRGPICLVKTNAFLPAPSQAPLPTPVPTQTPTPTPAALEITWSATAPWIAVILVLTGVLFAAVFLRRRKGR